MLTHPADDAIARLRADYDETPYTSDAFPQSAPGRLAAIAYVFGLRPPDVSSARVLEIGCAAGGNLIPFAVEHLGAEVVGIDLSPVQIELGRARAAAMGLSNVQFIAADIARLDVAALGRFDYVIAHGVYSWVPDDVREALLATCRAVMSPNGVTYLSYNTYPGWKSKEVMREAMLLAAGASTTPEAKVSDARDVVEFLESAVPAEGVMARVLAEFRVRDEGFDDSLLLHDELEAFNAPCYFHEMLDHAGRHGLTYLAEAHVEGMFATNHGQKVAEWLARKCGGKQVLIEQYLDFVTNRAFRETLLVHAENASRIRHDLNPARFAQLHFAGWAPPVDGPTVLDQSRQEYEVGDGATLFTNDPGLKAAMETLNDNWPWTVSREELVDEVARRLHEAGFTPGAELGRHVDNLIGVLIVQGNARFRLDPVRPATGVLVVPEAVRRVTALIRPGGGESIFNPWHEALIPTELDRLAFPLLDGTRDRETLIAELSALHPDSAEVVEYVDALPERLRELKLA